MSILPLLLQLAAIVQLVVGLLALVLTQLLGWKDDLERMPLLMRQVFHVHSWFISLTLAIFAVLTWRFASEMAEGDSGPATWLAGAIGTFWGVRTLLQIVYYSPSHWRGRLGPTVVHIALLLVYGSMSAVYILAASQGRFGDVGGSV